MKIAITGTSSSIGRAVVQEARNLGVEIVELNRHSTGQVFDLASQIKLELGHLDAFVHLGWDWAESYVEGHRNNIENILQFLDSLAKKETKLVLLSSESASGIPISNYGKLKRELEKEFSDRGGLSIRAGLLWGSQKAGIVDTVFRLSRLPLLCPHLDPDPRFFVSHESEVAKAILSLALTDRPASGVISLKSSKAVMLSEISHHCQGARKIIFHTKVRVSWIISFAGTLSSVGVQLPFRVDSLRSLLGGQTTTVEADVRYQNTPSSAQDFLRWLEESQVSPK